MNDKLINDLMKIDLTSPANRASSVLELETGNNDRHVLSNKGNFVAFDPLRHVQITEDHARIPYRRIGTDNNSVKWGQLKLFMVMLQFFNKHWDPSRHPNPKIVYVGAAPGSWWPLFSTYYPVAEIHLYDPDEFDVQLVNFSKTDEGSNITIYNKLFGDEDVSRWIGESDVFFVSDIRTRSYECREGDKYRQIAETQVKEEMSLQKKWVEEINPAFAQLKFRLPYQLEPTNQALGGSVLYEYLDGILYFQPWVGPTSTECRLVSESPHQTIVYNFAINEEIMFAHNVETRYPSVTRFYNIFTGKEDIDVNALALGLDNSWDSTSTLHTIKEYLEKTSDNYESASIDDALEMFKEIDTFIGTAAEREKVRKGYELGNRNVRLTTKKGW